MDGARHVSAVVAAAPGGGARVDTAVGASRAFRPRARGAPFIFLFYWRVFQRAEVPRERGRAHIGLTRCCAIFFPQRGEILPQI